MPAVRNVVCAVDPSADPGWGKHSAGMAREQLMTQQAEFGIRGRVHLEFGKPTAAVPEAAENLGAGFRHPLWWDRVRNHPRCALPRRQRLIG